MSICDRCHFFGRECPGCEDQGPGCITPMAPVESPRTRFGGNCVARAGDEIKTIENWMKEFWSSWRGPRPKTGISLLAQIRGLLDEVKEARKAREKRLNPFRHFILYAKGHYHQSGHIYEDVLSDLKHVAAAYTGMYAEHVSETDVMTLLGMATYPYITDWARFQNFLERLDPDSFLNQMLKKSCFGEDYGFRKALVGAYLMILYGLEIRENGDVIPGRDLGEPDPSILPLAKPEEEQEN